MSTKMKGLFKGLRYISQIFDNEKEPEMIIGQPTDVKHVAHIGWDGPSVTSPSWMNEFKSSLRHTAPLDAVDKDLFKDDSFSQQASEGSSRGGACSQSCHGSPARELPNLPRSTRRNSSTGSSRNSPTKAKSERVRPPQRYSKGSNGKDATDGSKHTRRNSSTETSGDSPTKAKSERVRPPRRYSMGSNGKDVTDGSKQLSEDGIGEVDSPTRRQHPDVLKKSRRKKSKDSGGGSTRSSSRSKTKASSSHGNEAQFSDPGTKEGSVSVFKDRDLSESTRRRAMEEAEAMDP